jgi:hypothetical protein
VLKSKATAILRSGAQTNNLPVCKKNITVETYSEKKVPKETYGKITSALKPVYVIGTVRNSMLLDGFSISFHVCTVL